MEEQADKSEEEKADQQRGAENVKGCFWVAFKF